MFSCDCYMISQILRTVFSLIFSVLYVSFALSFSKLLKEDISKFQPNKGLLDQALGIGESDISRYISRGC